MVYLSTVEEWQRHSSLLLQARPATAHITTKYTVPNLELPKYQIGKKRKRGTKSEDKKDGAADASRIPRGTLTLKAYDPESGVTLKFKTDKGADVGRMIAGLGRVGRYMAALPEKTEAQDLAMEDAIAGDGKSTGEKVEATKEPVVSAENKSVPPTTGGGGGGKKKKKGKK